MPRVFEPQTTGRLDPRQLATQCVESGSGALLLDAAALPPEFFDLSSRIAGELLHQLGLYRIRLAVVISDATAHSEPFQDFVREANRGAAFRFFETREEARAWLQE